MTTDICFRSASRLAAEIRAGILSPVTIIDAFLKRIKLIDKDINAYTTVCASEARSAAEVAAKAVDRCDSLGPLHGVPVAIKDLSRVRGVRTTFGSSVFAEYIPDVDDIVVNRLREAGAIILGKTNTPEFGRKTVTDNPVFGQTNNPWDLSRTVGGSSGGSAAAVAAGLAPIALGSDAAGSVRIPSSACGVVGMVPDFGRVPVGPTRSDAFENQLPYTFYGPITRTVKDAALMLDVIVGPHQTDPHCLPAPSKSYRSALGSNISEFQIGYSSEFDGFTVGNEVHNTVTETIDTLVNAGADIAEIAINSNVSWDERHEALERILQTRYVGLYEEIKRNQGIDLLTTELPITSEVRSRIRKGLKLTMTELAHARQYRTVVYDEIQDALEEYDILITPTLGRTPFTHDTDDVLIDGESVHNMHGWTLTWPMNLSGNPAGSVPIGFASNGLPVGLQVIGPRHADRAVVRACGALENILSWRDSYPPTGNNSLQSEVS